MQEAIALPSAIRGFQSPFVEPFTQTECYSIALVCRGRVSTRFLLRQGQFLYLDKQTVCVFCLYLLEFSNILSVVTSIASIVS